MAHAARWERFYPECPCHGLFVLVAAPRSCARPHIKSPSRDSEGPGSPYETQPTAYDKSIPALQDPQQSGCGVGEWDGFLFDPSKRGRACGCDGVVRGGLGFGQVRQGRR